MTAPGAGTGLLQLHAVAGPDTGIVHELQPGRHHLGRGAHASIRVGDPSLSRIHAEIVVAGRTVTIRDLESTNGTWVGRHTGWAGTCARRDRSDRAHRRLRVATAQPVRRSRRHASGPGRPPARQPQPAPARGPRQRTHHVPRVAVVACGTTTSAPCGSAPHCLLRGPCARHALPHDAALRPHGPAAAARLVAVGPSRRSPHIACRTAPVCRRYGPSHGSAHEARLPQNGPDGSRPIQTPRFWVAWLTGPAERVVGPDRTVPGSCAIGCGHRSGRTTGRRRGRSRHDPAYTDRHRPRSGRSHGDRRSS
jgi:hypothetical protein